MPLDGMTLEKKRNKKMSDKPVLDFPMEGAMMSDMIAMTVIGAMIQSDLSKELQYPTQQITAIGFTFAKEFLRQREEWLKPKPPKEESPKIVVS
jgi:hypothetical protein